MQKKYKRILYFLLALLVILFLVKEAKGNGDFKVFLEASKLIFSGENPYQNWIFVDEGSYALYFYSPLWVVFLCPLTLLDPFFANLLWLSLSVAFTLRCFQLFRSHLTGLKISAKQVNAIMGISLLLSLRFIIHNLEMIQMTLFLLWGCLESMNLIREKKSLLGAGILALIINVKILPIVVLPYLIYRGYFKAFFLSCTFLLLSFLLPAIVFGWDANVYYHQEWWKAINPQQMDHLFESALGPHSLTALIPSLFTATEGVLPYSRNLFSYSVETVIMLTQVLQVILILSVLLVFVKRPFKNENDQFIHLKELSYLLLLIPLIFPHQQKYAFVMAWPAQVYLVALLVKKWNDKSRKDVLLVALLIASFVLMTLSTDGLIGKSLNQITQHYKFITWGSLCLVFAFFLNGNIHQQQLKKT